MFTSIFIILISAMLFIYWFRYTCLLILRTRTTRNYAAEIAHANRLTFLEKEEQLATAASVALHPIFRDLDRDYRLITYLLRHAASYTVAGDSVERYVLMADFQVMRFWYTLLSRIAPGYARKALVEMAAIVHHLANSMGERVAVSARS